MRSEIPKDPGSVLLHLLQDGVGGDVDDVAGWEVKERVTRDAKECFLSVVPCGPSLLDNNPGAHQLWLTANSQMVPRTATKPLLEVRSVVREFVIFIQNDNVFLSSMIF